MSRIIRAYGTLFSTNSRWLQAAGLAFLICTGIGVLGFFAYPQLLESIIGLIGSKVGEAEGPELVRTLFATNLTACLLALFGGLFIGLGSLAVIATNGFLLGFVVASVLSLAETSLSTKVGFLIAALLPHGIFEIPAVLLAAGFGLQLGLSWPVALLRNQNGWYAFKQSVLNTVRVVPLLIVLLVIAALVEVFVSGALVSRFIL